MYTAISIILLILLLGYAWYRSSAETRIHEKPVQKDSAEPCNTADVVEELEYPHEDITMPNEPENAECAEKPEEQKKPAASKATRKPKKTKD